MDKLGTVLAELAATLGTTVEHLWPAIVKYRVGVMVGTAVIEVLVLTIGVSFLARSLTRGKFIEDLRVALDDDDPQFPRTVMSAIAGGVMAITAGIMFATDLPSIVGTLVSPEGSAAMWLISLIGGNHRTPGGF